MNILKAPICFMLMISILYCSADSSILKSFNCKNNKGDLSSVVKKMKSDKPVTIVCYGDSVTYGYIKGKENQVKNPYPKILEGILKGATNNTRIQLINEGHPGWATHIALMNVKNLVIAKKPDLAIIMFGINDNILSLSLDEYENNLKKISEELNKVGIKVLLMTPTPIKSKENINLIKYCERVKKVADDKKLAFINLHYALIEKFKSGEEKIGDFIPDSLHPREGKYQVIADIIYNYFKDFYAISEK